MESGLGHFDFLETIDARGGSYTVHGICDEEFTPVYEAFKENFEVEEELGAACSVVIDGETVVDLWAAGRAPTARRTGTSTPQCA